MSFHDWLAANSNSPGCPCSVRPSACSTMSASLAVMNGSISASLRHEVSAAAVHRQNAPRSHAVILFCCFMIVSVYLLEFFQQQVINIPAAIFLCVGGYRVDGNLRIGRDTIKIERVVLPLFDELRYHNVRHGLVFVCRK